MAVNGGEREESRGGRRKSFLSFCLTRVVFGVNLGANPSVGKSWDTGLFGPIRWPDPNLLGWAFSAPNVVTLIHGYKKNIINGIFYDFQRVRYSSNSSDSLPDFGFHFLL